MTISGINTPSLLFDTKKITDSGATSTDNTVIPATETNAFPSVSASNNTGTLTQGVLQTLQNFGLDTSTITPDKNSSLQSFIQNLHQSLILIHGDTGGNSSNINNPALNTSVSNSDSANPPTINLPIGTNTDSSLSSITASAPNILSGGTNFKYSIDLSQANLGDAQSGVVKDLTRALDNIGQYVSSNITFNIKVIGQNMDPDILAEADATMTESTMQSKKMIDSSFVSDVTYKSELNPNNPDTNLFINLSRIKDMSFDGIPASDKFDFTSILTHEILHGLAFTGTLGNVNTDLKSQYDKLVTVQGGIPYFIGANAENANGGSPVPLAAASAGDGSAFYHVDIPSDLMSTAIKKGQVKNISPIDIGILEDVGIPVVNNVTNPMPNVSKIQSAYRSTNNGLQSLIGEVQQTNNLNTSFANLIQSFSDPSSPPTNIDLSNFMKQLDLNTQNNPSLQNSIGNIVSVNT
jgi:hypothetical protein